MKKIVSKDLQLHHSVLSRLFRATAACAGSSNWVVSTFPSPWLLASMLHEPVLVKSMSAYTSGQSSKYAQVPYLRDFSYTNKEKKVIPTPHYFSGNSAPWFTKKAVERSPYWTQDISNATVILVDDYCYKLWWLSYVHSDTKDQLPGERLQPEYSTARTPLNLPFTPLPLVAFGEKFLRPCGALSPAMTHSL